MKQRQSFKAGVVTVLIICASVPIFRSFGQSVPQPKLTIATQPTNLFSVKITNAVTTTNYTLFWSEALNNPSNPWQVLGVGAIGQTNFNVDAGDYAAGFFLMLVGSDRDGDGFSETVDAAPSNPAVGLLSLTITFPANGSTIE